MSLILDALRRSESRDSPEVSVASNAPGEPVRQRRTRAGLIVLCCLLLGVAAGWLIRGKGEQVAAEANVKAERSAASQVTTRPESAGNGPSFSSGPPAAGAEAGMQAVAPRVDHDRLPQSAPDTFAGVTANPMTADLGVAQASVVQLNSQMWADADADSRTDVTDGGPKRTLDTSASTAEADSRAASSIAPPVDLAAAIQEAAQLLGEPSLLPHPAVLLENLSQQQKDQVPTIVYSVHAFDVAGLSTVTLNRRRLGVGERAGSIEVVEILPDSVILKSNGVVFRLRALNTWVNL